MTNENVHTIETLYNSGQVKFKTNEGNVYSIEQNGSEPYIYSWVWEDGNGEETFDRDGNGNPQNWYNNQILIPEPVETTEDLLVKEIEKNKTLRAYLKEAINKASDLAYHKKANLDDATTHLYWDSLVVRWEKVLEDNS